MKLFFHRIKKELFYKTVVLFILLSVLVIAPFAVFAADETPDFGNVTGGSSSSAGSSSGGATTFVNPLGVDSLGGFIDALLDIIIQLAVPVIALFIIYAGFLMVTARGDVSQLEKAKKTLLYTLIGAAVILGAKVISDIITSTLLSL